MGSIKPAFIKRNAEVVLKKYGDRFGTDYAENKKVLASLTKCSKITMNRTAGYITRKVKQAKKHPGAMRAIVKPKKKLRAPLRRRRKEK